ncbi:MAG: GNAT family N-acetyltransferase [Bacteroidota bacterium]|nr:GNAT family N-acetyltransferase [Bacteroidota bacterium]MDP4233621.1 GNAT family N-acetyltransferase [Bacteroidota bacterium]MDP4243119.1 GNAT family N-acetyltransferase [Bacteroidota bacterium]MDP4288549.1 GNAT family N-acetyltransferase [Bacteroidota bacterium]
MPSTGLPPLDLSRFFEVHPRLETERLVLREITMADQVAIFEYASDPEATQYMVFPTHRSVDETIPFIESCPRDFAARTRIEFGIVLKENGTLIGTCGMHHFAPDHHRLEIGYILNRSRWGKGYMTEAANELIRFAFDEMGMHRVQATCDLDNERSARVMERCGMTHEATLTDYELRRGKFVSIKIYGIVKVV